LFADTYRAMDETTTDRVASLRAVSYYIQKMSDEDLHTIAEVLNPENNVDSGVSAEALNFLGSLFQLCREERQRRHHEVTALERLYFLRGPKATNPHS
jgi:hypothetical protein